MSVTKGLSLPEKKKKKATEKVLCLSSRGFKRVAPSYIRNICGTYKSIYVSIMKAYNCYKSYKNKGKDPDLPQSDMFYM